MHGMQINLLGVPQASVPPFTHQLMCDHALFDCCAWAEMTTPCSALKTQCFVSSLSNSASGARPTPWSWKNSADLHN